VTAPLDSWLDPRVRAGTERLLARRRSLLCGGAAPLGWKMAFGPVPAREALGLTGPVVGFLTDATLLRPGERCPLEGWTAPKLEPELAIHLAAPLGAGTTAEQAAAAISGVSAAIELADVDRPATELEEVVAGDIYHRRVALSSDPPRRGLPAGPIAVAVERNGEPLAATDDAEAAVGRLAELTAYAARYLAEFGCGLAPGEILISGSTVPLLDIAPGQEIVSRVAGVGEVGVLLG
jgi:2-keto-4-pentenoate hydratase